MLEGVLRMPVSQSWTWQYIVGVVHPLERVPWHVIRCCIFVYAGAFVQEGGPKDTCASWHCPQRQEGAVIRLWPPLLANLRGVLRGVLLDAHAATLGCLLLLLRAASP